MLLVRSTSGSARRSSRPGQKGAHTESMRRLVRSDGMRRVALSVSFIGLLAIAAPSPALSDSCTGTPTSTRDTARGPVVVIPGRSIGPISLGMTRRQISRVARRVGRQRPGELFRAFSLAPNAPSTRERAVPERLAQAIPQLNLVPCGPSLGESRFVDASLPSGTALTYIRWLPAPWLPGLSIEHDNR